MIVAFEIPVADAIVIAAFAEVGPPPLRGSDGFNEADHNTYHKYCRWLFEKVAEMVKVRGLLK